MKRKIIYTFWAGIISLLTACVNEPLLDGDVGTAGDGMPVTLSVGVMLPDAQSVATRANMLDGVPENPDGNYLGNLNLYMLVFEDMGSLETNYLREVISGEDIKNPQIVDDPKYNSGENTGHMAKYKTFNVTLQSTSENAIIHLIATSDPNLESQLDGIKDRSELGIFYGSAGLYTQDPYDAYWRRKELNMPITTANKDKLTAALSHVMMTRSFAGVTLEITDNPAKNKGFDISNGGYVLINAIDRGYVAAYNAGKNTFVDFQDGESAVSYKSLVDGGYIGVRHPLSERKNKDTDADWLNDYSDWNNNIKYTFERPYQSQHKTYLLIKGSFNGGAPRYIKIDIGAIDGTDIKVNGPFGIFETYHLLRNIKYRVLINEIISDKIGYDNPQDALLSPPANNVSTSVETGNLTNIYDGVDHMQVNMTKLVIVDTDSGDPYPAEADIMWRYWKDYKINGGTLDNSVVKWNQPGYDFKTLPDPSGIIADWIGTSRPVEPNRPPMTREEYQDYINTNGGSMYNYDDMITFDTGDGKGDWTGFHVKFNQPDDIPRQKIIRLYRPLGLSRDITFIMRKRWQFVNNTPENEYDVEVYPGHYSFEDGGYMPDGIETMQQMREWYATNYGIDEEEKVGSHRGAQLTVMFELPPDLPEAIFPLDFKIEADRQNIDNAYIGNAVVATGLSLFEDVNVARIQFTKTVTWEYYHGSDDVERSGHRIVTARFLTTTDLQMVGSVGDESITRIRVGNPYFLNGNDTFKRESFQDVVDPTRTRWYWRFTHTEWRNYHGTAGDDIKEAGTLNDLHFAAHIYNQQGGGYYMAISTADGGAITNPAFEFQVDIPADKMKGTLLIDATPNKVNSGNDLYERDVYIGTVLEDNSTSTSLEVPKTLNAATDRLYLQTLTFDLSKIDTQGKTVKKILIWSTPKGSIDEPTRFFAIDMTLTE